MDGTEWKVIRAFITKENFPKDFSDISSINHRREQAPQNVKLHMWGLSSYNDTSQFKRLKGFANCADENFSFVLSSAYKTCSKLLLDLSVKHAFSTDIPRLTYKQRAKHANGPNIFV